MKYLYRLEATRVRRVESLNRNLAQLKQQDCETCYIIMILVARAKPKAVSSGSCMLRPCQNRLVLAWPLVLPSCSSRAPSVLPRKLPCSVPRTKRQLSIRSPRSNNKQRYPQTLTHTHIDRNINININRYRNSTQNQRNPTNQKRPKFKNSQYRNLPIQTTVLRLRRLSSV